MPGPAGPQGIQGPSGITFVNGTNVYLNQSVVITNAASAEGNALCDEGDFVVNGGFAVVAPDRDVVVVYDRATTGIAPSFTTSAPAGSGWETGVFTVVGGTELYITAFCFDNPPLRP